MIFASSNVQGCRGFIVLGGAVIAVALLAGQAYAADTRPIDVPAGDLTIALEMLAKQSGVEFVYETEQLRGLHTQGVRGEFTPENAVTKLLEGTKLTVTMHQSGAVLIAAPQATSSASPTGLLGLAQSGSAENQSMTDNTDSKLEEIVVTAERREESIQSLPIAISAFSGDTLAQRGIGGLQSLQQIAPGLQFDAQPGLQAVISVRGMGNEIQDADTAAAVSRDGVVYTESNLLSGDGDFFDVERIEVLRGPQGTLSGRNATAGAIYIHSNRPTDEFEGSIKATLGNYERLGIEGVLSGPVVDDRLLGRLAVRTNQADGWVTNTLLDQKLNDIDSTQARASLLARLTDNFEAFLILEGLRDRSTPLTSHYVDEGRLRPDTPTLTEALGVPAFDTGSNTARLSDPSDFDIEKHQATLRLDWELAPSAKLTATTGYVDQEQSSVSDFDATALTSLVAEHILNRVKQVSQEVTLTADLSDRLDMIAGALYLDSRRRHPFSVTIPAAGILSDVRENTFKLTSWAGYTQWRYRLTDLIRLTSGVRYTHDTRDYTRRQFINGALLPPLDAENSWDAWTPRFSVDYAPTHDLTLYASVSRGFKSGGMNVLGNWNPEFVWSYETGAKASWLDGRVNTALTGFYMDYTDLQQQLIVFDAAAGAFASVRIVNAQSATITGVELDFDALVTDQLRFTFAGTWLDATYDDGFLQPDNLFPELGAPLPEAGGPNVRDLSGNRLFRAPEWQFNVSGEYRKPLGFLSGDWQGVLRASYAWQDQIFFDIFNHQAASQGAYGLVNLFAAIESSDGRWQLSAFVHNLTDEHYSTSKALNLTTYPVPAAFADMGAPRRYGVSLAYRF